MEIYNFHPTTHEYIGTSLADPDPMVKDNWLIPANATTAAPPTFSQNEIAVFNDGEWLVQADYRGQEFYDENCEKVTITELGVTPLPEWTTEPPPPPLQSAISTKLANINASCEAEIAAISAGYPASEVLSWPKQEDEARAWTADNQAVTPLLDSLAAARGISKAELASRVIAKADLFAQLSGAIIGKRQGLEDQLDAISDGLTAEELEAPITPEVQALLDDIKWDAEL